MTDTAQALTREIQLDRVSGTGGAAFLSCTASTATYGPVGYDVREIYLQTNVLSTSQVYVNVYADAAVTAGIVIPYSYVSPPLASQHISFLNLPVASLSAICCFSTSAAFVNILWRR